MLEMESDALFDQICSALMSIIIMMVFMNSAAVSQYLQG